MNTRRNKFKNILLVCLESAYSLIWGWGDCRVLGDMVNESLWHFNVQLDEIGDSEFLKFTKSMSLPIFPFIFPIFFIETHKVKCQCSQYLELHPTFE